MYFIEYFPGYKLSHKNIGVLSALFKKYLSKIENRNVFKFFIRFSPFFSGFTYIGKLYFLVCYSSEYAFSLLPRKGLSSID